MRNYRRLCVQYECITAPLVSLPTPLASLQELYPCSIHCKCGRVGAQTKQLLQGPLPISTSRSYPRCVAHLQPLGVQLVDLQFRQSALVFFLQSLHVSLLIDGDGSVDTFQRMAPLHPHGACRHCHRPTECACVMACHTHMYCRYVCDKCVRGVW